MPQNLLKVNLPKNGRVLASEHVKIGQDHPNLIFLTTSLILLLFLMQNWPNYQTVQAVWLGVSAQNLNFRVKLKPYFEHTQKIGHQWPKGAQFLDGKSQYYSKNLFFTLDLTFYQKWEGPGLQAKKQARTLYNPKEAIFGQHKGTLLSDIFNFTSNYFLRWAVSIDG